MKKSKCMKQVSVPVFLLVIVFAMSSWIDLYGVYVELPLFVTSLPEGWTLPSYLGLAVEAANIGPLLFVVAMKLCPGKIKEWPFILIIIGVGATMCLCLVFLWDKTAHLAGQQRSVGLISICSILALVDCTSTVVYVPYMARFKTQYLKAYFIGEGLGSLLPGLVGLAQGVGSEPQCVNSTSMTFNKTTCDNVTTWTIEAVYDSPVFSVEVYLLFLFGIMVLSGISFLTLHLAPFCKREHSQKSNTDGNLNNTPEEGTDLVKKEKGIKDDSDADDDICKKSDLIVGAPDCLEMTTRRYILLLILAATTTATTFGILMPIMPYSAIPYGDVAYNLMVRLWSATMVVGAFVNFFYSTTSLLAHVSLVTFSTGLVGYHVFLAYCSPSPPLHGTTIGAVLMVGTGVVAAMVSMYAFMTIGTTIKMSRGRLGLMWHGACCQVGTCLGMVGSFIVINILKVFTDKLPCE